MAISANNPRLSNQIKSDVPEIQQKEAALLKMDPTNVADLEVGAKRLTEISSGNWQFQTWNGSQWVNVGKLKMDVDTVDGYDASITPKANTVAVRGSNGKLQDSITGNAATADSAVTISTTLEVGKGGTGATSSAQARTNLGVPPTSHASTNTTYGLSSDTQYGHVMATSAAPKEDTDAGSLGSDVTHFARGDHSHKKVLGTASVYGQVKLSDSTTSTSTASSHIAASPKAVKAAYDAANTVMTGATSSAAGMAGRVPAPAAGQQSKFLRGDGTWQTPTDKKLSIASQEEAEAGKDNTKAMTPLRTKQAINALSVVMPVGAIYIQFAGQSAPADIFGGTWSNISSSFAGRFFRAEGGAAASFGSSQNGGMPNITGSVNLYGVQAFRNIGGSFYEAGSITTSNAGHSGTISAKTLGIDASLSSDAYGEFSEIRPINSTIRIWKRTA